MSSVNNESMISNNTSKGRAAASFNISYTNETPTKLLTKDKSYTQVEKPKSIIVNTAIKNPSKTQITVEEIAEALPYINLEEVFKKKNRSDELFMKINFLPKKIGDAQTLCVLKYLDKANGEKTKDEVMKDLECIVGKINMHGIEKTLTGIFKTSFYKFKE